MALQPGNGDAVVTRDPDEPASWDVSAFPGLAQLRYRSADAAIDAATDRQHEGRARDECDREVAARPGRPGRRLADAGPRGRVRDVPGRGRAAATAGSRALGRTVRQASHRSAIADASRTARRVAFASIAVSALLACSNIVVGLAANSSSVLATGFEFAGDVLASCIVVIGMGVAARPLTRTTPMGTDASRRSRPLSSA